MHRTTLLFAVFAVMFTAAPVLAQQPRPQDPARAAVAPGDEIKLDDQSALKAAALESKVHAILANFALLQRQAQDLQTELKKVLEERKKVVDDAAKKARVDVREATEWVYEEAGQRYIRPRKPATP
jgi:vancomycin resistance protein YoaR